MLRSLLLGFALLGSSLAQAGPAETSVARDIKTAQQALASTQTRVGRERSQMAAQLNRLEAEANRLRAQAAAAQRQADEATLSLQQLQNRLSQWREQQAYQGNQMARFLRQFGDDQNQMAPMVQILAKAQSSGSRLDPAWQNREVVLADGRVSELPTLRLGPLTWYWQEATESGGYAQMVDGLLRAGQSFKGGERAALEQVFTEGQGALPVDTRLEHSARLAEQAESPWAHIAKGGLWAVPIMLAALVALVVALVKAWQLWRLPAVKSLSPRELHHPATVGAHGPQADLLKVASEYPRGSVRDDQLFVTLQVQKHRLEQWLGAIAVIASVAPLLGLLGTVSGMIETFKMMTLFGAGDPQVVSGGISQALITTELGLVVAIPALILNALLSRKAKNYYTALENCALQLSQPNAPAATNTVTPTPQRTHEEVYA